MAAATWLEAAMALFCTESQLTDGQAASLGGGFSAAYWDFYGRLLPGVNPPPDSSYYWSDCNLKDWFPGCQTRLPFMKYDSEKSFWVRQQREKAAAEKAASQAKEPMPKGNRFRSRSPPASSSNAAALRKTSGDREQLGFVSPPQPRG